MRYDPDLSWLKRMVKARCGCDCIKCAVDSHHSGCDPSRPAVSTNDDTVRRYQQPTHPYCLRCGSAQPKSHDCLRDKETTRD